MNTSSTAVDVGRAFFFLGRFMAVLLLGVPGSSASSLTNKYDPTTRDENKAPLKSQQTSAQV